MSNKIEDILAQCIEDIRAGTSSVEDCLTKYPSVSKKLEPLLRIALEIREPPDVKPSTAFKVRARVQLMEQIHAMRSVTKWPWFRYTGQVKPITYKRRFSMVSIIVAIVLAVCAAGGGTVYASQDSLPGEVLYPVKLGTEHVRVAFAGGDTNKAELYLTFANRRVEEMTALTEKGRPEKVDIAVNGYDEAIAKATQKMEAASSKGLDIVETSELVAEKTSMHLGVLEGLMETVPEEATGAIEKAIEASKTGQENALRALAGENPERAIQINLMLMEQQLNRVRVKAEKRETTRLQEALQEFNRLTNLGEEICQIAKESGKDVAVYQLVGQATANHLAVLAEVHQQVQEQAQLAIENTMQLCVENHVRVVTELKEKNMLGELSEELPIPEGLPDDVKDKLLKRKGPAED